MTNQTYTYTKDGRSMTFTLNIASGNYQQTLDGCYSHYLGVHTPETAMQIMENLKSNGWKLK